VSYPALVLALFDHQQLGYTWDSDPMAVRVDTARAAARPRLLFSARASGEVTNSSGGDTQFLVVGTARRLTKAGKTDGNKP
jgi:hypothetical protein